MVALLALIIYNISHVVLIPLSIPFILIRRLKGKTTIGNLFHRIGFTPRPRDGKPIVWLHAVSVGEVLSAAELVKQLEESGKHVLVTLGTTTGHRIATEKNIGTSRAYLPYDVFKLMFWAFIRIRPSAVIVVESELWPNMLAICSLFKIKKYLINARIPDSSLKRYKKYRWIYRSIFNAFDTIYCQSSIHVDRFKAIGVKQKKLIDAGDLKVANFLAKQQKSTAWKPIKKDAVFRILVGSLHPGELDVYLSLYEKMGESNKHFSLILAPRHFHWHDELMSKLLSYKKPVAVWNNTGIHSYSGISNTPGRTTQPEQTLCTAEIVHELSHEHQFVVLSTLGKLFDVYQLANVYYLGGTFVPIGGHNIVEPCTWSVPTLVGPHCKNVENFAHALENDHAGAIAEDSNSLVTTSLRLFEDPLELRHMGQRSRLFIENQNKHVAKIYKKLVASL